MTEKININSLPHLWPYNIDFEKIFNNQNPIDVELGCGRPHFFFDRALNFSQRNIIGIEYKYEFMNSAQKRIIRDKISNALAIHGNAWLILPLLFKPNSIANIFINFPDPWWKKKHKKRLLLNEIYLKHLQKKLTKESLIILQTDVLDLFLEYKNLLLNNFFVITTENNEEIINFTKAKTHREKKCLEQEMPIYRAIFKQNYNF